MRFDEMVNSLLNEMALEKESDVIYLSEILNQQRLDWKSDAAKSESDRKYNREVDNPIVRSAGMITSRGFNKAIRNHFGAKLKYPMRLIIDDVNNKDNKLGSRGVIESDILPPVPGVITFYLHPGIAGAAHHTTPFIIGHNVGHTMQSTHSTSNLEDEIMPIIDDIFREEPALQDYVKQHGDYVRGKRYDGDDRVESGAAYHAYNQGDLYDLLTPNLAEITDDATEWIPNLVGLYIKYGRIKFRLGNARKLEEFFDSILRSYIGKVVAIG